MGSWKKEYNKDYHFITVQPGTTKNYKHQFMLSVSGIINVYMALRSITQEKGILLNIESLNLSAHYWGKLAASTELTGVNATISTYVKENVTAGSSFLGVSAPIYINAKKSAVAHLLTEVARANVGVARINSSALQATV